MTEEGCCAGCACRGWPEEWPRRSLTTFVAGVVVILGFVAVSVWSALAGMDRDASGAVLGAMLLHLGVLMAGIVIVRVVAAARRRGGRLTLLPGLSWSGRPGIVVPPSPSSSARSSY